MNLLKSLLSEKSSVPLIKHIVWLIMKYVLIYHFERIRILTLCQDLRTKDNLMYTVSMRHSFIIYPNNFNCFIIIDELKISVK